MGIHTIGDYEIHYEAGTSWSDNVPYHFNETIRAKDPAKFKQFLQSAEKGSHGRINLDTYQGDSLVLVPVGSENPLLAKSFKVVHKNSI